MVRTNSFMITPIALLLGRSSGGTVDRYGISSPRITPAGVFLQEWVSRAAPTAILSARLTTASYSRGVRIWEINRHW